MPVFEDRVTSPDDRFSDRFVWLGPRTLAVWLTHEEAFRLSAVWACVNVIAKAIASCCWEVYLEDADGNRELQRNTRTWNLLNVRPNDETTPFAFKEAALLIALTAGDFFAEIERDTMNRPLKLWQLTPDRCRLEREPQHGDLVVRVSNRYSGAAYGYGYPNSGVYTGGQSRDVFLDYNDVYHLHGPGFDGVSGFDVVMLAAQNLATMKSQMLGIDQFYANGMQLSGILTSPRPLSDPRIANIRSEIEKKHRGQPGGFLILSGGMTWTQLSTTPRDAQASEVYQSLLRDCCRWWGVPPHKIGDMSGATFSNIEQQSIEFVRDGLTPWAERMAQEADWKLLPSIGPYKTRIDTDWLAEGDANSKAVADSTRVNNGLLTRNEARRARGLNAVGPEGDQLSVNGNLITLKAAVERSAQPPAPTNPQPGQATTPSGVPGSTTEEGQNVEEANGATPTANGAANGAGH
jgi:HK97 family phage portal protein